MGGQRASRTTSVDAVMYRKMRKKALGGLYGGIPAFIVPVLRILSTARTVHAVLSSWLQPARRQEEGLRCLCWLEDLVYLSLTLLCWF